MIMNTSTNRILEHLNIFSIDYYKKQQQQEQQHEQQSYDEIKMNTTTDQHDKTLQATIKDERRDHYVSNYLKTSPTSTDNLDQPLLIVLDEDELSADDENAQDNLTTITDSHSKDDSPNKKEQNNDNSSENPPKIAQSLNKPKTSPKNSLINSKLFRHSRTPPSLNNRNHSKSEKLIRTVVIDTAFMRQTCSQQRNKLLTRRKNSNMSSSSLNMSKNLSVDDNSIVSPSTDSILSNISFDNVSDVLTISRMGSIFYCLEDLYSKVFSSLCTLDEFTNLITKSELILIKQATLSEKFSLEKQLPSLKNFTDLRYRLLSINSSDYLLKLKQLLLTFKPSDENEKRIEQIIHEIRSYKCTPTPVLLKDNVSHSLTTPKRLSTDDDDDDDEEPRKRLKIVTKKQKSNETPPLPTTQFGIFIQCNGPVSCNIFSTNETVSSTSTNNTETTVNKTESDISSKSMIIKKQTENENTQIYFEKFPQKHQNISKFNLNNERTIYESPSLNRTESQSPPDCTQINKTCSSAIVMNMPIKRRILNSYNSDTSDSSCATSVHLSHSSVSHSRYLYRSKSLTYKSQQTKAPPRRSTSLPSIEFHVKEQQVSQRKYFPIETNSKLNVKSKAEPIDLTDESFSMPMIVNVEENVELANLRQKVKNKKASPPNKSKPSEVITTSDSQLHKPSPVISRPISHDVHLPVPTKPTPTHQPPVTSYRPPPYVVYQQESYTYREQPHTMVPSSSVNHSYQHSTTIPTHGTPYSYSYSSATQYPIMKKSKETHVPNCYDTRPNSFGPPHPLASSNIHHHTGLPASVVTPIVRKPNYYHQLTPEQQALVKQQTSPPTVAPMATPCRLPCCCPPPTMRPEQQPTTLHSSEKSPHNERFIYRPYTVPSSAAAHVLKREPSQTPDNSPVNRKQRRIEPVSPYSAYPSTKSYFAPPPPPPLSSTSFSSSSSPLSSSHWPSASSSVPHPNGKPPIRYVYPPQSNAPMNGMARKIDPYPPSPRRSTPIPSGTPLTRPVPSRAPLTTPVVAQNSSALISPPNTPNESPLTTNRTRGIDLQRALVERGYCDMDKIPKLVVRHTKTYSNKAIDTMGQLFPTWFNEPDYRCIHCFRCDQVFTPQQFMTHVDDEQVQNEQPISMTSIQLLTSEKMSEYKVGLWNQFCTNLTIYASDVQNQRTTRNSVQRRPNRWIFDEQKCLKAAKFRPASVVHLQHQ